MINNALSILQTALLERFTEDAANAIWLVIESAIFLAGLICIVILVVKYGKRSSVGERQAVGLFGESSEKNEDYPTGVAVALTHKDVLRGFFNPAVILFICYSLFSAFGVLFLL